MRRIRPFAICILCIILLLSCTGCGKESATEPVGKTVEEMLAESSEEPVTYNGVTYYPKAGVQAILLMGVDRADTSDSGGNLFGGQADAVGLLVMDREKETYGILQIDRNTICSIPVLNAEGESISEAEMQLCLAHSYGSGGADSCVNTCKAVSNLLGVPVESYCALYMDAIPTLNDAVGGVPVIIEDDFSQVDESLIMGQEILLSGQQAYNYLRYRQQVGDGLNAGRLFRQKVYGEKYLKLLNERIQQDVNFAISLYQDLESGMVTSITGNDVNVFAQALKNYRNLGILTIDGESKIENGWEAFYPDEGGLRLAVLELFYTPE